MRIGILGAGKVGVVTGAYLADMGHSVIVTDRLKDHVDTLNAAEPPFYERGLRDLLSRNTEEGRLVFVADNAKAIENKHLVFIAVDTPTNEEGVTFSPSAYEACRDAECLLVATEWSEFRSPDFGKLKDLMKEAVIFDGRTWIQDHRHGSQDVHSLTDRDFTWPAPFRTGSCRQ